MSKKKIKCRLINKFAVKIMKLTESEFSQKKKENKRKKGKPKSTHWFSSDRSRCVFATGTYSEGTLYIREIKLGTAYTRTNNLDDQLTICGLV